MRTALVIFFMCTAFSVASSANEGQLNGVLGTSIPKNLSISELLELRDKIQQSFSSLSKEDRSRLYKGTTTKLSELFILAQSKRLQEEIKQEERIARSFIGYKGWEKDAAKEKIKAKKETLDVLDSVNLEKVDKPIRCLSDISKLGGAVSEKARNWASRSTRVYSKGSGSFLNGLSSIYDRDLPDLGSIDVDGLMQRLQLIQDNSFVISSFSANREEKQVGLPRVQSQLGKPYDELLSTEERAKLKEFGITNWRPSPGCKDFSHLFSTPKLQPPRTAKCAGYAIANDMESELNNSIFSAFKSEKKVSPEYAYVAVTNESQGAKQAGQPICNLIGAYADPLLGVTSISSALNRVTKTPVCSVNSREGGSGDQLQEYVVSEYKSVDLPSAPSIDFYTALLDNGITPMVTLSREARNEMEDWLYPKPLRGNYTHVVNLVGYCTGREPDCLNEVDYFIVRDSLGKKPIHYKIPSDIFLSMSRAVDKITKVKAQ